MDFIGIMFIMGVGIGLGKLLLVNGVNFVYIKKVFEQVGGFDGVDEKVLGDDVFFFYKIVLVFF